MREPEEIREVSVDLTRDTIPCPKPDFSCDLPDETDEDPRFDESEEEDAALLAG